MKQFKSALNVTVDDKSIIKGGYIQLPEPIMITHDWLRSLSFVDGYDSNEESVLYPLREFKMTEQDIEPLIGKKIYAVPDDTIYHAHLEMVRQEMIVNYELSTEESIQDFLTKSDVYVERILGPYMAISDLLISRIWSYRVFEHRIKNHQYMDSYKSLYMVSVLQLLLLITVNTPRFNLKICFEEN